MCRMVGKYRKQISGFVIIYFIYMLVTFINDIQHSSPEVRETANRPEVVENHAMGVAANFTVNVMIDSKMFTTAPKLQVQARTQDWLAKRQELLSKGGIKKVMLFCYMRGGSTFFSELFRQNQEVMYWYEPFDAFYSYLFGEKTWHFPQDIFWYQHSEGNSSLRTQQDWELDEMARFNHNMLTCNFSGLPIELFYHLGVVRTNMVSFRNCLFKKAKTKDPKNCRSEHIERCSGNSKQVFDNDCPKYLKLARQYVSESYNESIHTDVPEEFIQHARCNNEFPKYIHKCRHILEEKCKAVKMVTYKGLRVTMTSVESMLQKDPDLHVVYFVRDPRGTVTSRVKIEHTYRDTQNNVVLEAKYHCVKMLADLKVYSRLKEEYPGAILLVKYEDVTLNPYDSIARIYDFYGMCVHHSVYTWMKTNDEATKSGGVFSTSRANATASIDQWRRANTPKAQELMTHHCKEVLQALNYAL